MRKFKRWADKNHPDWAEDNDNGEWELGWQHILMKCLMRR